MGEITTNPIAAQNLSSALDKYAVPDKDLLASRLMYGTDWFFLALIGKQHVQYIPKVEALLKDKVPNANGFHTNAARYLGLQNGGQTAKRMLDFYRDDPQRQAAFRGLLV